ncbi:MAG: pyridoxamine 5'-phosphate oxidase family protein [Thermoleophilaceae bacterium]|nr:pyridoxamine 5'-phosphate oxidase family protein [Thermoleophilaceae bacterium]
MPEESAPTTNLTKLRREPHRADPSWATIRQILTDSYLCHLAFSDAEGQPFAIPTLHALIGDDLYVHGSAASRTMRALGGGAKVCVTVTRTDGFVFARSVLNHSINYRSVMVFGHATVIDEPSEKEQALHAFFEEIFPGRWEEAREPTEKEYARATILRIPLEQASAKVGDGPPEDEDYDYDLDVWAGVISIKEVLGAPEPDPVLRDGIPIPESLTRIRERWS